MNKLSKLDKRMVATYLMYNERYTSPSKRDGKLPKDDADPLWKPYDDLAKVYIRKIKNDFTDVKLYGFNHIDQTFKICLGSPKIHGRRVMRLPEISLMFTALLSPKVRFIFSDDIGQYSRLQLLYSFCIGGGRMDRNTDVSMHPHISADGHPCLGDFSQPWATTMQSNDLPMFINVAKSFLNNWTRRDAYWNINDVQLCWQDYVKPYGITFKDFLIHYKVLDRVEQISRDRNSYSATMGMNLVRWLSRHNELLYQGESMGMDFIDVWKGIVLQNWNTKYINDVKDGVWSEIVKGSQIWKRGINDLITQTHSLISEYTGHTRGLFNLTEDVMFGTNYVQRLTLTSSSSSGAQDCAWFIFWDGIQYVVDDMRVNMNINNLYNINDLATYLDCVVEEDGFDRLPTSVQYLSPDQLYYGLGSYWCREWFTDNNLPRSKCFSHFVKKVLKNNRESVKEYGLISADGMNEFNKEVATIRYGEDNDDLDTNDKYEIVGRMLYEILSDIFVWFAKSDSDNSVSHSMMERVKMSIISESIDIVEEHYETQLRRVTNGKSKYARAYGVDTKGDAQQDTVSA